MDTTLASYNFIDVHYHANPDLYERRYSALEIGQRYQEKNAAVVLKSHIGSTALQATLLQSQGYPVLGSVVLNDIAGGIDYKVVLRCLMEYRPIIEARFIVHLPTTVGRKHQSRLSRQLCKPEYAAWTQKPLTVFNENHKLKQEVLELIRMSENEPIVLSTGHASKEETYELVEETAKYPHCRLMLNQPSNPLTGFDATSLADFSGQSHVYIEQTALTYLLGYQSADDFKQVVTTLPRVLYSSDLGQVSQMDFDEYVSESGRWFKAFQLTPEQKEMIWKTNPMNMLTL